MSVPTDIETLQALVDLSGACATSALVYYMVEEGWTARAVRTSIAALDARGLIVAGDLGVVALPEGLTLLRSVT